MKAATAVEASAEPGKPAGGTLPGSRAPARGYQTAEEQQAAADQAKRLKALLAREAVEHATAQLAAVINARGKPCSIKAIEARCLRVLEASISGEVAVPAELIDAVKTTLDYVRWRVEMTKGKPRQRTDLSVATKPVQVYTGVKKLPPGRKPEGESDCKPEAALQVIDLTST